MIRKMCVLVAFTSLLFGAAGCSGSDDGDDDEFFASEVTDMRLDKDVIREGEDTVLKVRFRYDNSDVFNDDQPVVVTLVLPPGVNYIRDSSELDTIFGDKSIGADVFDCDSGETVVVYDLDEDDLDVAENQSGGADAELTLTIIGEGRQPLAAIQGRADTFSPRVCNTTFIADAQTGITVE